MRSQAWCCSGIDDSVLVRLTVIFLALKIWAVPYCLLRLWLVPPGSWQAQVSKQGYFHFQRMAEGPPVREGTVGYLLRLAPRPRTEPHVLGSWEES